MLKKNKKLAYFDKMNIFFRPVETTDRRRIYLLTDNRGLLDWCLPILPSESSNNNMYEELPLVSDERASNNVKDSTCDHEFITITHQERAADEIATTSFVCRKCGYMNNSS